MVSVSRNSFARHNVVRETVAPENRKSCDYCGNRAGRFRYGIDPDSGRKSFIRGAFCCKQCCEDYHDKPLE